MDFDASSLLALAATGFMLVGLVLYLRQWGRGLSHGGKIDKAAWEMFAAERGYDYVPDPMRPRFRGVHDGVSFEVAAKIIKVNTRWLRPVTGVRVRGEYANTSIRVAHRAALPPGTVIRRKHWGLTLGSMLSGHPAISVDDDYASAFRVECEVPEALRKLLAEPDVKRALLAMIDDLPNAVVHERAIEAKLTGMASDTSVLDTYLGRVTAVAKAFRAHAPQVDRAAPADRKPVPMVTAADLPERTESLTSALNRLGTASSRTSQSVQASTLKLRPFSYQVDVRTVTEGVTRLGMPTGGLMVRGSLARSPWRVEVNFPPEDNDTVRALKPRDRITGLLLVDDLRGVAQVAECTATTPPIVVEAAPEIRKTNA